MMGGNFDVEENDVFRHVKTEVLMRHLVDM